MTAAIPIEQEAQIALDKTKIELMDNKKLVFFSTVMLNMKHRFNSSIPTACTDGLSIQYNPKFWLSLPVAHRLGVLVHEIMHVVLQHMTREGERNHDKFNRAADYAINNYLDDMGISLPKWVLMDHQYDSMTAEQIYDLLPDEPPGYDCDIIPADGETAADLAGKIDDIIIQASIAAQKAGVDPGTLPGDVKLRLQELTAPTLPWHRLLLRWFTGFTAGDYSFKKPNRRYFPRHLLPSLHSPALANVAIFGDISGSVSDEMFKNFVQETVGVVKKGRPKEITFGTFDSRITAIHKIRNANELGRIDFHGRGGTQIPPVYEWAEKNKPAALIIFSDGEFHIPEKPSMPVIWVIHSMPSFKAPYGKVIHYEFKKKQ